MACYKPLTAWQTESGEVIFAERGAIQRQLTLACGQCIGCRLERSRQWAIRCMHEAKMHRFNSFVTLTYAPEHLPENGQLVKRHPVLFIKRLREALGRREYDFLHSATALRLPGYAARQPSTEQSDGHLVDPGEKRARIKPKVRFYLAGEYGEQFGRPHFHICLFGVDFKDKIYLAKTPAGSKLYRSPTLERLWTLGHSSVGELTFESAAYAARYIMKKVNGKKQETHYLKLNSETGEIFKLQPEYNNMSRMPGLGLAWLEKYNADIYPEGKVIVRGKQTNTPRYYDKQFKKWDPLNYEQLQHFRHLEGLLQAQHNTDARLHVREQVAAAKISQLKRKLR